MPNLRESLQARGGDILFTEEADPVYQKALGQTSGVDVGGHEFTLTETDVQPYIDNPELMQMEADVTQARYGGTPIQGNQTMMAGPGQGRPRVDFSRRGDFENYVFNQLKTDNMPDGNPFNFNPTASMNAISKKDLPELFATVFQNQVTWDDRHLLDEDQKRYWMSEVKAYRAHLKGALDAEREEAVNGYNQMMNGFDNAAKEAEAARKIRRQKRMDVTKAGEKKRERTTKRQEAQQAQMKRRTELLTGIQENITKVMEATATGGLTDEEIKAITMVIKSQKDELKAVNADIQSYQMPKPRSGMTVVEAKKKGEKPSGKEIGETFDKEIKKAGKSPKVVRGKIPKQGEKTIIKRGTYKGRRVVKYSDGSIAYADETE